MLYDSSVKSLKRREKPYKKADERGLYLQVNPNGSKYWRFKYRFAGKEKLLAIGTYPDISLSDARDAREEARRQLRNNQDPSLEKKKVKVKHGDTFEALAREWHSKQINQWSEKHANQVIKSLEDDIFPWLAPS